MSQSERVSVLRAARRAVESGSLSLVLGARGKDGYDLRRVEIAEGVANDFRTVASAFLDAATDARLVQFDVGFKPDRDELLVLDVEEFEEQELATLIQEPARLESYQPGDGTFGRPLLYALVAQSGRASAAFIRKSTQVQVGRAKSFLGLVRAGRVESLDEPVLSFDATVDVLISGGLVVVANPSAFQQLFKDMEALVQRVEADLKVVTARVPIANLDEFLEACRSDPRMMTKLGRVARRPYLAQLTVDDVRDVIERYTLPDDLVDDWGELVYSQSRERRWLILKLLDDDYLESRMTEQQYEVNSKLEHRQ